MSELNDPRLGLMIDMWKRLNDETLQYMRMLDYWIMFFMALLVALVYISRQNGYRDAIVLAAIVGAIAPVWIGRVDVLIHRPVPAVIAIEKEINDYLQAYDKADTKVREGVAGWRFKTWENHYKPQLKTGVKILVPLDAIAMVFLFILFAHANNQAAQYLADIGTAWSSWFWITCWVIFLGGIGIIAFAKPLAE